LGRHGGDDQVLRLVKLELRILPRASDQWAIKWSKDLNE
jgi:hypothetical protein